MNIVKSLFFRAILLIMVLATSTYAQINTPAGAIIPFGSNPSYPNGMMPTNLPTGGAYGKSTDAANAYTTWKANYIVSCASGTQFRVKFDNPNQTVSEGIAYGMLLAAYAADKTLFDGLWAYYKANVNGNGVMNWRIDGCNTASGSNGATDAELDAALALLVADAQWPLATTPYDYTTEATSLINKIKNTEMDASNFQATNGDAWGTGTDCRNPSYQAPAYYRLFGAAVPADVTYWGTNAVNGAYTLIQANAHATTGLVSDWSNKAGATSACQSGSTSGLYGYDACRNPWRMGTDYIWNAESRARTQCDKIASYVNSQGAANCGGPRQQNGSGSGGHYATFVSTYATAIMGATPATYQNLLNAMYTQTVGVSDFYQNAQPSGYFGNTLRCVALFMMSGNFWKPGTSISQEINVQRLSANVASGSTIDLGNVQQGTNGDFTFTIQNLGATALSITNPIGITGGSGKFTIQTAPATSVAANGTTTFVLRFTPGAGVTGAFTATLNITNNDGTGGENPYVINVLATGTTNPTAPEIDVQQNSISIPSGNTPSFSMGNVTGNTTNSGTAYKTFTIVNTGTATLTTTVGVTGTGYSLYGTAPTSVAAGASATFTIAVNGGTTAPATRNGTVTITNNDNNEASYVINLTANILSCTNTLAASQVLQDYEANNNVTLAYNPPPGAAFSQAATNPSTTGLNNSPIVAQITRDATTYVSVRYQPGCGSSGTFDMSNPVVSILFYSPAAGIPIFLSPKTAAGNPIIPDYSSDVKNVTTKVNQWERLYFDMSNIINNTTVRFLDIMIDPTGVNGTPSKIYRFDDIRFDVVNCITSLPSSQVFMDYDGERNLNFVYTLGNAANNLAEVVANPSATGINTTPNVARFTRHNALKFQGWRYSGCQNKIDLSANPIISMKVYTANANVPINMSLTTSGGALVQGVTAKPTAANTWQKIYFDFTASKNSTTIAFMDIYPDTGIAFPGNLIYYVDEIRYDVLPCATPATANAGTDITICAGGSATLAGSVTNATGSTWSGGLGTFTPNTTTLTASYTPTAAEVTAGIATLTLTTSGMASGCPAVSDQVVINISAGLTTAAAGTDQTVCTGTATLAGNAPTNGTGTWSVISGTAVVTTPSSPTSGITGLTAGASSTLRWTISGSGCTPSTDDVIITRANDPTTSNAGTDQTVCAATATLAGNTATVGTGAWTVISGTAVVTTPSSPTSGITGLTTGASSTLRWTISNSPCVASTDDVIITRANAPTTSNAGIDQTVCAATATLAGNTATVGTGAWSVISGTAVVTTPSSPTSGITGLTAGASSTLRWTISNSPCVASTDDIIITRSATPTTSNAGTDQTVCAATATLAGNTATVGTGAWTVISGTAVVTTPSSPTSGITGLTAGASSTLRWTISNSPCIASTDDVIITRANAPTTSNAGTDQNVCGTTATLAANTATVGTGSWSVVTGTATITTASSPTSGITGLSGSATLRWTISNSPCTASSDDVIITQVVSPTTANAGSDQSICASATTLAGNTATTGTGSWSVVSGTASITTPSSPTSGVTGLAVGSTTLRWTISNSPCAASTDDVVITVTGGISTADAGIDQTVCAATSTLAGNTPTSGTGSWSVISGTAVVTTPSSPTSGVTGLTAGASSTLRWTITGSGCPASTDDIIITRSATPTTSNAGTDQTICAATTTLAGNTATVGTGAWTVISGTAVVTTPSSPTSGVMGLTVGSATLRWTISNSPCTASSDDVIITVTGAPTVSNAGSDQSLCASTTATLAGNTATVGTGAWTVISGTAIVTTPSNPTSGVTGLVTGSATLRWTISNAPCTASSDDVVITVVNNPTTATAGSDQSICATSTTLSGNAASVGTGSWSVVTGAATFTTPSSPTSSVTGLGIGSNTLRWTISNTPCTASSDDVVIIVTGGITTADAGIDQNVLLPSTSTTLGGNTPGSGTGAWSVVSGTATITTTSNPTSGVTGLGAGYNVLRWTISNGGCTPSTDDVSIFVGSTPGATTITGPSSVSANQTNVTYTFSPVNPGSVYTWTVPSGSTIVSSGPGTVTINFGSTPGNVSLTETNPLGSHTSDLPITIGTTAVLYGLGTDTYEAYPSPFEDITNLKINSTETAPMKVKVMDSRGVVIYSSNEFFTNQNVTIGKEFAVGIYYVEVSYQNKMQIIKLIKM